MPLAPPAPRRAAFRRLPLWASASSFRASWSRPTSLNPYQTAPTMAANTSSFCSEKPNMRLFRAACGSGQAERLASCRRSGPRGLRRASGLSSTGFNRSSGQAGPASTRHAQPRGGRAAQARETPPGMPHGLHSGRPRVQNSFCTPASRRKSTWRSRLSRHISINVFDRIKYNFLKSTSFFEKCPNIFSKIRINSRKLHE